MTPFTPQHSLETNNITLVVQDYDGADETTDGEMPDLDTFDVDLDDLDKMESYESNIWDENSKYGTSLYSPVTPEDIYHVNSIKNQPISQGWTHSQTQSPLIYKKSATFIRNFKPFGLCLVLAKSSVAVLHPLHPSNYGSSKDISR